MYCKPSTGFPKVQKLLDESSHTSLLVIVVKGKKNKLMGLGWAWDYIVLTLQRLCKYSQSAIKYPGFDDVQDRHAKPTLQRGHQSSTADDVCARPGRLCHGGEPALRDRCLCGAQGTRRTAEGAEGRFD